MGSTIINTYPPTKKMFGDKEVLKEVWNGETVYDKASGETPCIEFSSAYTFSMSVYNNTPTWTNVVEYSTNKNTWSEWDGNSIIAVQGDDNLYHLYLRGYGNKVVSGFDSSTTTYSQGYFVITSSHNGSVDISGELWSLIDYIELMNGTYVSNHERGTFAYLFYNNNAIRSVEHLTNNGNHGKMGMYYWMFKGCEYLTTAPTTLKIRSGAIQCYSHMFDGCTRLVTSPAFTSGDGIAYVGNRGMEYMFQGTAITTPPEMQNLVPFKNTSSSSAHYQSMFAKCTNLIKLPYLNFTDFNYALCNYMFSECSKIKISETQTGEYVNEFSIPGSRNSQYVKSCTRAFEKTGGTYTGDCTYNTVYYTSNQVETLRG